MKLGKSSSKLHRGAQKAQALILHLPVSKAKGTHFGGDPTLYMVTTPWSQGSRLLGGDGLV